MTLLKLVYSTGRGHEYVTDVVIDFIANEMRMHNTN